MRRLTPSDYRRMPWKNGGGTTTELAVEPLAGAERFLYRASIADVAVDGPFSLFEGYDRHIVLLEGAGMTLVCGPHGDIPLARHVPRTFSGDWPVDGRLTDGPVRDFNLMVDRAHATSSLEVRALSGDLVVGTTGIAIVHVLEGTLEDAAPGDTLIGTGTLRGRATIVLGTVARI